MFTLSIVSAILAASSLVNSAALIPRQADEVVVPQVIGLDEVLVFGADGRREIVKTADYHAELERTGTMIGRPDSPSDDADSWDMALNETESEIEKRCTSVRVIHRNKDQDFLDWDLPMSSAFHATVADGVIAVTEGYSVSDSITVTVSADYSFIVNVFTTSVGISYTHTWTSTYAAAYTSPVPKGKWGIMVSNPRVYRRSGNLKTGCVGSQRSSYFHADQHFSNDYKGLAWVQGTISLCTSDSYPIRKCIGDGFNH